MYHTFIPVVDVFKLGGRLEGDPMPYTTAIAFMLPESASLVKRIIWRHLGGRELGSMEVPDLINKGDRWGLIVHSGEPPETIWVLEKSEITRDLDALPEIVKVLLTRLDEVP